MSGNVMHMLTEIEKFVRDGYFAGEVGDICARATAKLLRIPIVLVTALPTHTWWICHNWAHLHSLRSFWSWSLWCHERYDCDDWNFYFADTKLLIFLYRNTLLVILSRRLIQITEGFLIGLYTEGFYPLYQRVDKRFKKINLRQMLLPAFSTNFLHSLVFKFDMIDSDLG